MAGGRAWDKVDRLRWGRVRRLVLARDGWRCRQCGRRGRLEVDHIEPQGEGEFCLRSRPPAGPLSWLPYP